jgi:hypothetical protein
MRESEDQPLAGQDKKGAPVERAIVNMCAYCKKPIYSDEEVIDAEPLYFHSNHKSKEERVAIADMIANNPEYVDAHQASLEKESADYSGPTEEAGTITSEKIQEKSNVVNGTAQGNAAFVTEDEEDKTRDDSPKSHSFVLSDEKSDSERAKSKSSNQIRFWKGSGSKDETPSKKASTVTTQRQEESDSDRTKSKGSDSTRFWKGSGSNDETHDEKVNSVVKEEESKTLEDTQSKQVQSVTSASEPHKSDEAAYHYESKVKKGNNYDFIVDYTIIICGALIALIGGLNGIWEIITLLTNSNLDIYSGLGGIILGIVLVGVGYWFYNYGRTKEE